MSWRRKSLVLVLSLVLLVCLVGWAATFSINHTLDHPKKVEGLLSKSDFYGSLVDSAISQAKQAEAEGGSTAINFDDPAVVQAARSALSSVGLKDNINKAIESNYSWLQGKAPSPKFTIDLVSAKQDFANAISQQAEKRLSGLSTCTPSQLLQLQQTLNYSASTLPCLPPGSNSHTLAANLSDEINNDASFLNDAIVTSESLNTNGQSQPYYQTFSKAPQLYQTSRNLPIILGIAGVLTIAGLAALLTLRSGIRLLAILLFPAGLILLIGNLVASTATASINRHIGANLNLGALHISLTAFFQSLEDSVVRTNFIVALIYLALGLLTLLSLRIFWPRPRSFSARS